MLLFGLSSSTIDLDTDGSNIGAKPRVRPTPQFAVRRRPMGTGSGFLVSRDGLIATNYHVIEKAHTVHVIQSDKTKSFVVGVAAFDEDADIAIIRVIDRLSADPLALSEDELPPVGTKVF